MQKKNEENILVFEIIESALVALNCLYQLYAKSISYDPLHTIAFTAINKYGKGAAMTISAMFERVYDVAFRRILETGIFRH